MAQKSYLKQEKIFTTKNAKTGRSGRNHALEEPQWRNFYHGLTPVVIPT